MRKILYSLILVLAAILTAGCNQNPADTTWQPDNKNHFRVWREANEQWFNDYRDTSFGTDSDVVRTEILPSGILIEVYHDGYGAIPKRQVDPVIGRSSDVYVDMEGYLIDGTNFLLKGATEYAVSDLIEGVQQVLSTMRQGSHWKVYLPYEVGYGDNGSVGVSSTGNFGVPPYSTLIFDIDLLDVTNY